MGSPSTARGPGRSRAQRLAAVPCAVGLLLSFAGPVHGQSELDDAWTPFTYFAGAWGGEETGSAGVGTGERVYAFILNDKYLMSINTSRFGPQEQHPEGEVREDYSIFSYDELREVIVLREFHSEGFVNRYVLSRVDEGGHRFVFESEHIENLPPGWKASVSMEILDSDRFVEVFELTDPGGEQKELIRHNWVRQ